MTSLHISCRLSNTNGRRDRSIICFVKYRAFDDGMLHAGEQV
jgi:hypothetical protein